MAETHELRLKIDAGAAQSGARQFTSAIKAVKQAVRDLERDTTGAFTTLRNIRPEIDVTPVTRATTETNKLAKATTSATAASDRAADNIRRTALASANALRVSTDQASRLRDRLLSVGDTAGLAKLDAALSRLKTNLTNATTGLDVREARAGYADLASELNRTAREAERLRAIANANAREMEEASRAAAAHGETLDRLRAKYNPLYSASKAYETALDEIALAEREGAISAQMAAQARERAAVQLGAASAAVDQHTAAMQRNASVTQQGVMVGHQLSDVLITSQMGFQSVGMIALQQGSQLAAQMNSLKASGGGVFRTLLAGFTSLVNPLSLITIGAVAAGAAIAKWFFAAGEETKSFSDALSDANSRVSELRSATEALSRATLGSMADGYGRVNEELRRHLDLMRRIAEIEAINSTRDLIASVQDAVTSDGNLFTTELDAMRRAFDTTNDRARSFLAMLDQIKQARTFEEQLAALTRMRSEVESVTGGLDGAEGAAQQMLIQLIKSEDAALRLRAAQDGTTDATDRASGAASSLAYTIGTAADEAARLLMNLNSVPSALAVMGKSVEGQIASIQAQNRALNLQISEGLSSVAANRRVQLQTMIDTAGERGQRLTPDQIAAEWKAIAELDAAAQEQARLRERLSEMNRPARKAGGGSGGGSSARTAALSEEQQAVDRLNESLQSRLDSLTAERIEMGLLASGQMETAQGAQAMAEAMMAGGGAVDAQTEAMVRQIDAAAKLNEELRKVATDPVKEWMDSVPNWIEAGQQIEMGAINHLKGALADFIKTGKFDIESLGEAILGTIADIVADKAVAELMNLMGRNDPGATGLGGVLGNLFGSQGDAMTGPTMGGADVAQGGIQAGQSISQAMVQAGNQVSQQISSAMMQGGQQVQMAHAQGGQQAANAARTAGIQHGQQVRMATTTSGGQHATQVRTAITTAGQQHAQAVGMAASGGGGFLSGIGGWQGLLGMAFGAFDVGGISTEPANFASAPVAAFRHAPHFAQGTPNTSSIPAILHENEAVIPLTKGRKVGVELRGGEAGGTVINMPQTFHIATPDADSFRKSKDQIAADMARSGQRAIQKNG